MDAESARLTTDLGQGPPAQALLRELLASSVVLAEDWEGLAGQTRMELQGCSDTAAILPLLVRHSLLTEYQAARVYAGDAFGLVLGNYRVLDRIVRGRHGASFSWASTCGCAGRWPSRCLPLSPDLDSPFLSRFLGEMRAVAQLQHPNIVSAIDDGRIPGRGPDEPPLHYCVMEYVPGRDLEEAVLADGPHASGSRVRPGLPGGYRSSRGPAKHGLVHRDVKPSNVRVTPDGLAKLLDFGLVLRGHSRMTEPGTVLGTLDYLAPD